MDPKLASSKQRLDVWAMAILVILCISWGVQQVSIKVALEGVSPMLQSGIRSIGATALLWIWMVIRRESLFEQDGTLWWGLVAGLMFAAEFLLLYLGLGYTNASRSTVFLYTSPFVVALGAQWFIPGERLTMIQIAGLCCAFTGIIFAFSESLALPTYRMLIGDALVLAGGIIWGATTVLIKASPLATTKPSKTLFYQLAVSAIVLTLGSLVIDEQGIFAMTPLIAGCLVYQIVWVAFITYLTWFWLIRSYPASRLAAFTFLTPLFGVVAGGLHLNEPITNLLLLALILVGAGIYMVNYPAPKR